MAFTGKDIIKLIAEHGILIKQIKRLRWAFDEYEFGRAKLVAERDDCLGHGYSGEGIAQIGRRLKEGRKFYVNKTSGNDFDFGTMEEKKK